MVIWCRLLQHVRDIVTSGDDMLISQVKSRIVLESPQEVRPIQQAQDVARALVFPLGIPVLHIVSLGVHEDPGTVIGPLDHVYAFM